MTPVALAAAVAAFNLVCAGKTIGTKPTEFSLIMRVDLKAQRYCMDDCAYTLPIAKITETEIIFADDPPGPNRMQRQVSRETGDYLSSWKVEPFLAGTDIGNCALAPFTGFPTRKF